MYSTLGKPSQLCFTNSRLDEGMVETGLVGTKGCLCVLALTASFPLTTTKMFLSPVLVSIDVLEVAGFAAVHLATTMRVGWF